MESRDVLLLRYRMIVMKKGKMGTSVSEDIHYFDMLEIISTGTDTYDIKFKSGAKQGFSFVRLKVHDKSFLEIVLKRIAAIKAGHKEGTAIKLKGLKLPSAEPTPANGYVEAYLANCSAMKVNANMGFCDFVVARSKEASHHLDLSAIPGFEQKTDSSVDMASAILGLRYNTFFTSVSLKGLDTNQKLLYALGVALGDNRTLGRVEFVDTKDELAFETLAAAFKENSNNVLENLVLKGNRLERGDMITLALKNVQHAMTTINLADCGMNGKVLEQFFQGLIGNLAMSLTLEQLDISGNKLEVEGSAAMAAWLSKLKNPALSDLGLGNSALLLSQWEPATFKTLLGLRRLNLAGLKVEKEREEKDAGGEAKGRRSGWTQDLQAFFKECSLQFLNLTDFGVPLDQLEDLLALLGKNDRVRGLELILADNNIGKNYVNFVNLCETMKNVASLDISQNKLGSVGLRAVLKGIAKAKQNTLKALVLDSNGLRDDDELAMEFIAFLNSQQLTRLSMKGEGKNFKKTLTTIITALGASKSLQEFDFSGGQVGDSGAYALAQALRTNTGLKKLCFDGNGFTLSGLQALLGALLINASLREIGPFTDDLQAAKKSLSKVRREQVNRIWFEIQRQLAAHRKGNRRPPHNSQPLYTYELVKAKELPTHLQGTAQQHRNTINSRTEAAVSVPDSSASSSDRGSGTLHHKSKEERSKDDNSTLKRSKHHQERSREELSSDKSPRHHRKDEGEEARARGGSRSTLGRSKRSDSKAEEPVLEPAPAPPRPSRS